MSNIAKTLASALYRKKQMSWDKIYVAVDLHGTVLRENAEGNQQLIEAAGRCLKIMTERKDICLILWSASSDPDIQEARKMMCWAGIWFNYVNENPEVKGGDRYFARPSKPYFNVGIDDAFGFDPDTDWDKLIEVLEWYK